MTIKKIYYKLGKHDQWLELSYIEIRLEFENGHIEITAVKTK